MELRNWTAVVNNGEVCLIGRIYNDTYERFDDGTKVMTSPVVSGSLTAHQQIETKTGSVYNLGLSLEMAVEQESMLHLLQVWEERLRNPLERVERSLKRT